MQDYAKVVRFLVDEIYPHAEYIRLVRTISTRIHPLPCMRPFRRVKLVAFSNAWSSITPPNTAVG